ncbi:AraC family transcriptional regulator [Paractinoplanes abujensis]|uniref:AraC-like DNA-binding protein n=1 Tax=Paractinoplanes abujensis TaxID=882441 RepID=A0A7W7CWB3_9ACTN|nr:AraC family transcriptional regulator [Actinoplanes abujensis]MBB4695837.1 AraC-like DNA-binding protein [Actinoplanes abujensis]GID23425.1 AraC family transcriptional regulator [Actinoplanes abujensis]
MSLDELRGLLERHARSDASTAVDGVLIGKATRAYENSASMSGTVLALIAQGAKTLALGERIFEYRAGQYLVASVDLPVTGCYTEAPALGFGLLLDPAEIAELLLQAPAGSLPPATGAPSAIAVSDAPAELVDAAVRMLRLLETPRDIPVLAPLIRREILWRLITGEQGATVRHLGLADSSLAHVARAVQWIRDHYREAFRVEDVARLVGMSVSAFYRNFQAVTAMSPIQFQKQIRLQQARLMLATRPNDVTGVGHRVGYDSPSQFSREYRRQFGLPPSRDAAHLRAAPAAAVSVP